MKNRSFDVNQQSLTLITIAYVIYILPDTKYA